MSGWGSQRERPPSNPMPCPTRVAQTCRDLHPVIPISTGTDMIDPLSGKVMVMLGSLLQGSVFLCFSSKNTPGVPASPVMEGDRIRAKNAFPAGNGRVPAILIAPAPGGAIALAGIVVLTLV